MQEKLDSKDAREEVRSSSPLRKPDRQSNPQFDLRNNTRTIEVTTEHTLPDNNELLHAFNVEPHLDDIVIGADNQDSFMPSPTALSELPMLWK